MIATRLMFATHLVCNEGVNIVPKAVSVWLAVQYISDTCQYWCTVSGLPLFFIFICMYVCVYIYYNKYKSLP